MVTPGGTSPITPADQFSLEVPTVTSVTPAHGAAGTTVVIKGSGFEGATAVDFGSTPATSFTVNSNTKITAVAPAGTGVVDVTVTAPDGTSSTGPADQFNYAPTVTSINPTSGPSAGGTRVTVIGTNFTGATAVDFGGVPAASFSVYSGTKIYAYAPAGSGTVDVTVTGPGGTSATSPADQYMYS